MSRFDWSALMRAGAAMGLKPVEFWRLTPAELSMLLGKEGGASPLSRAGLEALAAAYPDHMKEDGHGG